MAHPNSPDSWPHLYREGSGPVIVTLHGYGGNEVEASGLGTWLHPDATLLSPRGTLVEQDTYRWYGRFTGSQFDPVDIDQRAMDLIGFLRECSSAYSFSLPEAIISGFSNGAAMALALGVLYPLDVRSVAVFSGVFPFHSLPESDMAGGRIWSSHGHTDMWVSEADGVHLVESCRALGAQVEQLVRPGGHGITEDEVAGARSFLGL